MFIRKKLNKSGTTSIQIIQKVGRRNKILKTIGSSSSPDELERLFQKALYEMPRLYGATLFDTLTKPTITELSNDSIWVCSPDCKIRMIPVLRHFWLKYFIKTHINI